MVQHAIFRSYHVLCFIIAICSLSSSTAPWWDFVILLPHQPRDHRRMSCGDALRARAYQPQVSSHTLLLGVLLTKIGYTVIIKQGSLIALSGSTDRGSNVSVKHQ